VAKLGDRARPGDEVLLDQKRISFGEGKGTPRVILYHKPVGELVTRSDPDGRPTVFANLPPMSPGRWVNVGRPTSIPPACCCSPTRASWPTP
jgi:23S rRNA pseudouridine2605 synthase